MRAKPEVKKETVGTKSINAKILALIIHFLFIFSTVQNRVYDHFPPKECSFNLSYYQDIAIGQTNFHQWMTFQMVCKFLPCHLRHFRVGYRRKISLPKSFLLLPSSSYLPTRCSISACSK